jgi:hypothetical protein
LIPSSTIDSIRCWGSEKKAISDDEKKAERPIRTAIPRIPKTVIVPVSRLGTCNSENIKETPESDKPIVIDCSSALKLRVVFSPILVGILELYLGPVSQAVQ